MIIYWDTLEKNAGDVARIPEYLATDYFGGVGRIKAANNYPASPPYGAFRYRSDLKKYLGFKEDSGWSEIGGAPSPTRCELSRASLVTIANTTWTAIPFDAEVEDVNEMHSVDTNPSRITIPAGEGGTYLFTAWTGFVAGAGGDLRLVGFFKDGGELLTFDWNVVGNGFRRAIVCQLKLSAGNYIEVKVYQNSGGNLNTQSSHKFTACKLA